MRLYHLQLPDTLFVGREFVADSDEHARGVAADQHSQTLHRDPDAILARWEGEAWVPVDDTSPITPLHPYVPPPEPGPPPEEPRPLVKMKLYESDKDRPRFGELSESLAQVKRALRQLERAQIAHRAEQVRRLELGFTDGRVPDELVALDVERTDAMEFAIVAAKRAAAAHVYLTTERGLEMPEFRQRDMVWALRDLYEHWEVWKTAERESFADDNRWLLTKRAGKRWDQASGGQRPEGTAGFSAGPPPGPFVDPHGRITSWCSIDIDQLTEDLAALRDTIAAYEAEAFEWELPDEAAAVELVGPTMWTLIQNFTNVRGRPARDYVVRWERAWLVAADRTLREQHWIINGEVLGPLDDVT